MSNGARRTRSPGSAQSTSAVSTRRALARALRATSSSASGAESVASTLAPAREAARLGTPSPQPSSTTLRPRSGSPSSSRASATPLRHSTAQYGASGAHSTAPSSGSSTASSGWSTRSSPPGSSTDWLTSSYSTPPTLRPPTLDSALGHGYGRPVRPAAAMGAAACIGVVLLTGCGGGDKPSEPLPEASAQFTLASPAFRDDGAIPKRFTCSGEGVSPALQWTGVPGAARELDLLVEDEDAERFVHWGL